MRCLAMQCENGEADQYVSNDPEIVWGTLGLHQDSFCKYHYDPKDCVILTYEVI